MMNLRQRNKTFMTLACLLPPLWAAACSDSSAGAPSRESGPDVVAEPTEYVRIAGGFETFEACRAANPDPVVNCQQSLVLCPNRAYIMSLTDIITEGSYVLDGDTLHGQLGTAGDTPSEFTLTFADDGSFTSADLPGGAFLKTTPDADGRRQLEEGCKAIEGRYWYRDRF
ncbi:MAG TPA: hypothetical protein VFS43_22135 [Polyangiaceae bacterium]|nr:hypothetical protein [Polyangiaceae bacterium]